MKQFFLIILIAMMGVGVQAQTLHVKNNSACLVSVRLHVPTGPGTYDPTFTYAIPPSGFYNFSSADIITGVSGPDFSVASVNTPPLCGTTDGAGVDNPGGSQPYHGISTGSFTVCGCGIVNVLFHGGGSPLGGPWLEIY